jgi:hypothetical protein
MPVAVRPLSSIVARKVVVVMPVKTRGGASTHRGRVDDLFMLDRLKRSRQKRDNA